MEPNWLPQHSRNGEEGHAYYLCSFSVWRGRGGKKKKGEGKLEEGSRGEIIKNHAAALSTEKEILRSRGATGRKKVSTYKKKMNSKLKKDVSLRGRRDQYGAGGTEKESFARLLGRQATELLQIKK